MKKIITDLRLKPLNMIIALAFVWAGFVFNLYGKKWMMDSFHLKDNLGLHFTWLIVVVLSAFFGLLTLLGKKGLSYAFGKPNISFGRAVLLFFGLGVLVYLSAIGLSLVELHILNIKIPGNPGGAMDLKLLLMSLPGLMFFEESWTAVMLIIFANYAYKATKNYATSFWIGSLLVSIVFGLGHIGAYWNGSLIQTIIHVLMIQGVSRIIFNIATYKGNTLWIPFLIHWAYDTLIFTISHKK